jgi:hypothetical protein
MAISLTSKLDAINSMLIGVGEAPVNTLNSGLQEAEIAAITLDTISREVQSAGWAFNTDIRYTLSPNSTNHIPVPSNCLQIDTTALRRDYDTDVVLRNQKLYDRTKNTFVFDAEVVVDMIQLFEFDEIPEVARRYITLRAGRKFQENILGSETMTQLQFKDEQQALFALRESESQVADFNIFDNYDTFRALDRNITGSASLLESQRILYS